MELRITNRNWEIRWGDRNLRKMTASLERSSPQKETGLKIGDIAVEPTLFGP